MHTSDQKHGRKHIQGWPGVRVGAERLGSMGIVASVVLSNPS